ncbi:MAG TPA: divalent-cation tolerance protein CutA [Ignisphaera sp.]|uniref:Divalent-cation tolerance protein CutA n=1 Tax=Ignisphaera aggregans TaxID=334771 RepID=A0A832Z062_9CREN|nr:divalent-cation tolerance protein CutA [Ignisphaera sp.]HIP56986.1 divalent-cation tolerance protein CutA [Ignisphaera aggregans]
MLGTYIVVLVTAPHREEAEKIARKLLDERVAACVNIVEGIKSLFWWQGKVDEANEVLMVIKTRLDLFEKVIEYIKSLHSYTVPEIIALPIVAGNTEYLKWIDEVVKRQ